VDTFTVRTAAQVLRVSPDTVRRWADKGILAGYRLPSGHRRFEPGSVLKLREQLVAGSARRAE
jgi:excisionase family DNA binding protein